VKFATVKRMITKTDKRTSWKEEQIPKSKKPEKDPNIKEKDPIRSSMFFKYNTALGPPYYLLCDTNFINFSISNKLDIITSGMDCLYGKCVPCITDCVMAELEKLGPKFKVALRMAKDPRFERLTCTHKGTYADDCIVARIQMHRCYIVATCDKDLKRRIRKIPGVPIMSIKERQFTVERMPDSIKSIRTPRATQTKL